MTTEGARDVTDGFSGFHQQASDGRCYNPAVTRDQVKAILSRIPSWPETQQAELAELALQMEAEVAGAAYEATPEELPAIDQGLAQDAATDEDVTAAFAAFKRT